MSKSRGFTLIELLVTVSIIAILAAIGLVAYSSVIKQGRDSKRQSDLRSIQSALEQYYSDQGFYPSDTSLAMTNLLAYGGSFTSSIGNPSPPSPVKTYINSVPRDPTLVYPYAYLPLPYGPSACDNSTSTTKCISYCLYARPEVQPSPSPAPPTGCPSFTGYILILTPP